MRNACSKNVDCLLTMLESLAIYFSRQHQFNFERYTFFWRLYVLSSALLFDECD
jgi:hypothetical protein